ncbi:hypothetical protein H8356DRAFT_1360215 [Neocallimastix lanati (nom. inval.)]|nr:hypothetical protein H8356DRAFT_1360215 [Neocallimastix sp. JGI-2020a]
MSLNFEKKTTNNNNFKINKIEFDVVSTELLSQITKKFKNNYTNTDHELDTSILNKNESNKKNINERDNDFINKTGLKISNLQDINYNSKENIDIDEIPFNCIKNSKKLKSTKCFIESNENTFEKYSYKQKDNMIKLKKFKKELNKFENNNDIKDTIKLEDEFIISSIDVERNIFSYNTYSEKYISEEEYASDTSNEYCSTSPFKYDDVIGINIPYDSSHNIFNKIASPQPESKFDIGSTIESLNEIADYIYENSKNKDINKPDLYNSRNNDPIKKNDIFIKNYFDQAKYSDKRNFYYPKNDYYGITYKSLSNKKINSNDVSEIKNKMESNKNDYDYINVFELETLNSYNIEPENRNPNEYVMTEALIIPQMMLLTQLSTFLEFRVTAAIEKLTFENFLEKDEKQIMEMKNNVIVREIWIRKLNNSKAKNTVNLPMYLARYIIERARKNNKCNKELKEKLH